MAESSHRFTLIAVVVLALVASTAWVAFSLSGADRIASKSALEQIETDPQGATGTRSLAPKSPVPPNGKPSVPPDQQRSRGSQKTAQNTQTPGNQTTASAIDPSGSGGPIAGSDSGIDQALVPGLQPERDETAQNPVEPTESTDEDQSPEQEQEQDQEQDQDKATLGLAGTVQTTQGQAVVGIAVSAQRMDGSDRQTRSLLTNELGRFVFSGLLPGDYRLQTPRTAQYTSQTVYAQAGLQSASIVVQRVRQASATGLVKNQQGDVLVGVSVQPPYPGQPATTDGDGRYVVYFEGKENQGFVLQFRADNYVDEILHVSASDWQSGEPVSRDVVLRSRGDVSINGNVTNDLLEPLTGALVQLSSQSRDTHQHTLTDNEGNYTISGIMAADDYVMKVSATNGYSEWRRDKVSIQSTTAINATLTKVSNGHLAGTITDVEGTPIPSFTLLVVSSDANGRSESITSDEFGGFEVASIASGKLNFLSRSEPSVRIEGPSLPEGGDLLVDLIVDWGILKISGAVTDKATGAPVNGAELVMSWQHAYSAGRSSVTRRQKTDEFGAYEFTELGPGARQLQVVKKGYESVQISVDPRSRSIFPITLSPDN